MFLFILFMTICLIGCCYVIKHDNDKKWWVKNEFKNFPVKWKGREFWRSRSVAVTCFAFAKNKNNEICVLANKRGPGTPDYQGCWNIPCGYLDWNETGEEGACREIKEETNVDIEPNLLTLMGVETSPKANRQNITLRYVVNLDNIDNYSNFSTENSEEKEVDDIKWIPLAEINSYEWAFNHKKLLEEFIKNQNV